MVTKDGERIQKVMASTGIASRREAEAWIKEGKVSVNGRVIEVGAKVNPNDRILVMGNPYGSSSKKMPKFSRITSRLVRFVAGKIQQVVKRYLRHCPDYEVVVGFQSDV